MSNKKPYRLGALAYIVDENKEILLVQLNNYKSTEWNFPGGGREAGETALQNITRELKEELNIDARNLNLIGQLPESLKYDFPADIRKDNDPVARNYRGQIKDQFVFRCSSNIRDSIKVDPSEVKNIQWCKIGSLEPHLVFNNQLGLTLSALATYGIS